MSTRIGKLGARAVAVLALLGVAVFGIFAPGDGRVPAAAGGERQGCDFDGDGFDDLAIPVPQEGVPISTDVSGREVERAGVVEVLYGTSAGLASDRAQWWAQELAAVQGGSEYRDGFGAALGCGDFDNDGFDDLVIGVPGEDLAGYPNVGAVQVLAGSATGLTADGDQWWDPTQPGMPGGPENFDRFGYAVAVGNFDGDSWDDLAIGNPGGDWIGGSSGGAHGHVQVLYGYEGGLILDRNQYWPAPSIGDDHGVWFGASLTVGDFDGDGLDDLAIGMPRFGHYDFDHEISSLEGAVQVLYGSSDEGLTADRNQVWHQDVPGIAGLGEGNDRFGASLAAGDFDGDGFDELAIGSPLEDIAGDANAGAVQVLAGSSTGLTVEDDQWWDQGQAGVPGAREAGDQFGWSLASADFDGDGHDDLAIGAPGEGIEWMTDVGAVQVFRGSPSGLVPTGSQWWDQSQAAALGTREAGDEFGSWLAIAELTGDELADLVIGVPGEDMGARDAGAVQVLAGSVAGLTAHGAQWWDQGQPGVPGAPEVYDRFGDGVLVDDGAP